METTTLKALSHPFRKYVVEQLAYGDSYTTAELKGELNLSKEVVSQHLKILRESQLILEMKVGRNKQYCLNPSGIREVLDWAETFQLFWSEKLKDLNQYLEDQHGED